MLINERYNILLESKLFVKRLLNDILSMVI